MNSHFSTDQEGAPRHRPLIRAVRRIPGVQRAYELFKNRRRLSLVRNHLTGGIGAELGVHKGDFTAVLLKHGQPQVLHAVDPWYRLGAEWPWAGGSRSTTRALANLIQRFSDELVVGQLQLHVCDDLEFLRSLDDEVLDWAYIDSTHEFAHTLKELDLLRRKVKWSGVIAGDDWHVGQEHRHRGVAEAVLAFCDGSDFELRVCDPRTRQWAISRPPGLDRHPR